MRHVGFIAAALVVMGCGPDPNATLPGMGVPAQTGATSGGSGGVIGSGGIAIGSGGTTTAKGTGGSIGTGGRAGTGGRVGAGGGVGSGGSDGTGGVVGSGGRLGAGGVVVTGGRVGAGGAVGTGGRMGTGGANGIDGGGGAEPCVPDKTITGSGSGNSGNFGTAGAYCFNTPDSITGWNCSNFTGRTLKVNGVTETCGAMPLPAKVNGFYYFDSSAGGVDYASIYWY